MVKAINWLYGEDDKDNWRRIPEFRAPVVPKPAVVRPITAPAPKMKVAEAPKPQMTRVVQPPKPQVFQPFGPLAVKAQPDVVRPVPLQPIKPITVKPPKIDYNNPFVFAGELGKEVLGNTIKYVTGDPKIMAETTDVINKGIQSSRDFTDSVLGIKGRPQPENIVDVVTDPKEAARFVMNLVPGMLGAAMTGPKDLREAVTGERLAVDKSGKYTGVESNLSPIQRGGAAVNAAINTLGPLWGGSKTFLQGVAGQAIKPVADSVIKKLLFDALKEGGEEALQSVATDLQAIGALDEESFNRALNSFGFGFAGGEIFSLSGLAINKMRGGDVNLDSNTLNEVPLTQAQKEAARVDEMEKATVPTPITAVNTDATATAVAEPVMASTQPTIEPAETVIDPITKEVVEPQVLIDARKEAAAALSTPEVQNNPTMAKILTNRIEKYDEALAAVGTQYTSEFMQTDGETGKVTGPGPDVTTTFTKLPESLGYQDGGTIMLNDRFGNKLASANVDLVGNQVVVDNIGTIGPNSEGLGYGTKLINDIKQRYPGKDIVASNVLDSARGFWDKMGFVGDGENMVLSSVPRTQKQAVAEAIAEEGKSIKQIAEETKILEPNVRRILGVGAKEGEFKRLGKGVYTLSKDGQELAYIQAGDAVETLADLAQKGFKADMVFLDIPYNTPAVKGGNRGIKYDTISTDEFDSLLTSIDTIARNPDSPVVYMYSQAKSGVKAMQKYTDKLFDHGFKPIGRGEYTKLQQDGITQVRNMRGDVIVPEGIIVFNKSGTLNPKITDLNFKIVRPKGYQTEKPAEMLKAIIEMTTEKGDVVLDPFAGSGVTGAEAIKAGRKATLIEKKSEVVEEVIKPRLKKASESAPEPITRSEAENIAILEKDALNYDTVDEFKKAHEGKELQNGFLSDGRGGITNATFYYENAYKKAGLPLPKKELEFRALRYAEGQKKIDLFLEKTRVDFTKNIKGARLKELLEEAKKTKTLDSFITSFGPSVYRGAKTDNLSESFDTDYGPGYYFAGDKEVAQSYGDKVSEYIVNVKNPFVVQNRYKMNNVFDDFIEAKDNGSTKAQDMRQYLQEQGYDGILVKDGSMAGAPGAGQYWVAFNPSQISTKQQLTDIYNKANAKVVPQTTKVPTPTVAKPGRRPVSPIPDLTNTEGDGVVVKVTSFGREQYLPLLDEYKGMQIVKAGEDIAVWDPKNKTLFRVGLDDSKTQGGRVIVEKANTVKAAKEYIDWVTKPKPVPVKSVPTKPTPITPAPAKPAPAPITDETGAPRPLRHPRATTEEAQKSQQKAIADKKRAVDEIVRIVGEHARKDTSFYNNPRSRKGGFYRPGDGRIRLNGVPSLDTARHEGMHKAFNENLPTETQAAVFKAILREYNHTNPDFANMDDGQISSLVSNAEEKLNYALSSYIADTNNIKDPELRQYFKDLHSGKYAGRKIRVAKQWSQTGVNEIKQYLMNEGEGPKSRFADIDKTLETPSHTTARAARGSIGRNAEMGTDITPNRALAEPTTGNKFMTRFVDRLTSLIEGVKRMDENQGLKNGFGSKLPDMFNERNNVQNRVLDEIKNQPNTAISRFVQSLQSKQNVEAKLREFDEYLKIKSTVNDANAGLKVNPKYNKPNRLAQLEGRYDVEYSAFKEVLKDVRGNVKDYLLPEARDTMNRNPDYIPMRRDFEDAEKADMFLGRAKATETNVKARQGVVRQKQGGSEREILSPTDTLLNMYTASKQAKLDNEIIAGLADRRYGFKRVGRFNKDQPGMINVTYFKNGKSHTVELPQEWGLAFKPRVHKALTDSKVGKVAHAVTLPIRAGATTYNVGFQFANPIRDTLSNVIRTDQVIRFVSSLPKSVARAATGQGDLYKMAMKRGIINNTRYSGELKQDPLNTLSMVMQTSGKKGWVLDAAKHPWTTVKKAFNISENVVRLAEFEAQLKAGKAKGLVGQALEDFAVTQANKHLPDYSKTGTWTANLNEYHPYLTASVAGTRPLVRAFKERPVQTSAKVATMIAASTAMVLNQLEDEVTGELYDQLAEDEKNHYLTVVMSNNVGSDNRADTLKVPLSPDLYGFHTLGNKLAKLIHGTLKGDDVKNLAGELIGSATPFTVATGEDEQAIYSIMQSVAPTIMNTALQTAFGINYKGKKQWDTYAPEWAKIFSDAIQGVLTPAQINQFGSGILGNFTRPEKLVSVKERFSGSFVKPGTPINTTVDETGAPVSDKGATLKIYQPQDGGRKRIKAEPGDWHEITAGNDKAKENYRIVRFDGETPSYTRSVKGLSKDDIRMLAMTKDEVITDLKTDKYDARVRYLTALKNAEDRKIATKDSKHDYYGKSMTTAQAIEVAKVNKAGNYNYDFQELYRETNLSEWKALKYSDPELYQKLYNYDTARAKVNGSGNSEDMSKNKYYYKGSKGSGTASAKASAKAIINAVKGAPTPEIATPIAPKSPKYTPVQLISSGQTAKSKYAPIKVSVRSVKANKDKSYKNVL